MADNVKQVVFNDTTYYIRRMDAFKSMEVFGDLQHRFAAPLASMIETVSQGDSVSMDAVVDGIARFSEKLDGKSLIKLVDALLIEPGCVSFAPENGEPKRLDANNKHMAFDSMADIVAVCGEVLTHNYADFLSQMASRFGLADSVKALSRESSATT